MVIWNSIIFHKHVRIPLSYPTINGLIPYYVNHLEKKKLHFVIFLLKRPNNINVSKYKKN